MKRFLLINLILAFALGIQGWAQDRTVTGNVTSADDAAGLPAVNVILKGTTTGATTDVDGNYRLSVPSAGGILVFSSIGFETQEIDIGNRSVIDVAMAADVTELSEVVVVGYGTQIKQDLTGNIAQVDGADIQHIPVNSFEQAIQGRAAGVYVQANNGKLGQGIQVRVRGSSSVSASNQPLYVVDGVPITTSNLSVNTAQTNPLSDINPNDIESIEILKDASAAAIYGSRAANGVVLITTKKGKSGKTQFDVDLLWGTSEPSNEVDWLNRDQYFELFDEAFANSSSDGTVNGTLFGLTREDLYDIFVPGWDDAQNFDTDWQKLAFQDAGIKQIDISASGGTDKTRFYVSGQYSDQAGLLTANNFERYSGRINLDHQANDKLSFGLNFLLSRSLNERLSTDNAFSTPLQAIAQSPVQSPFDPDGPGGLNQNTLYYNFLLHRDFANFETVVFRNLTNLFASYDITPELKFTSKFGLDVLTQNDEEFYGRSTNAGDGGRNGTGVNSWAQVVNYTLDNYFTYNKNINEDHDLLITAGMSYQQSRTDVSFVEGQQFPNDRFTQIASAAEFTDGSSTETNYRFLSYFARANYKFKNRYLLEVSGRVDGSSRFGSNEQYGTFPAVSAGWIMTNEGFLSGSGVFSFLKLRASWGLVGNAEIGNFPSRGLFDGSGAYAGFAGTAPTQTPNPDLKWEETTQIDVGLDFGILNDRITGEIDYYQKKTTDLLLNVNVPGSTGFRTQTQNVGELENSGFEFVVNSTNLIGEFGWTTSFNIAFNDNEITNLDGQVIEGGFINRAVEGEAIGVFFGPEYAGVDPDNGDALYFLNDGTEGTTNNVNDATQVVIGNPNPDFVGGFVNDFSYKGIDLNIFFQFVQGNDVYNGAGRFQETSGDFYDNNTVYQLNRWQNSGDITDVPQARLFGGNGTAHSSRYLQDGSYVRLKTVTLGYNLPSSLLDRINLRSVRIYVSGQNLLTFTKYGDDGRAGWDPEVNTDFLAGNIGLGNDFYAAPQPKTFSVGLNVGF
ncbi:MAG: TonB-dependent receptor [Cyclobacteriaceae bacterium]|nr:TonB-dependent receptor [Cyclobacteriaceae bacterium]